MSFTFRFRLLALRFMRLWLKRRLYGAIGRQDVTGLLDDIEQEIKRMEDVPGE